MPLETFVHIDNIPASMKAIPRWGTWYARKIPGVDKLAKVPDHPTSKPEAWGSFEETLRSLGPDRGLGFVMTRCQGIVGIDLDRCVQDGRIAQWALDIIVRANSYTEFSPSGTGIRIFLTGNASQDFLNRDAGIEMYSGHSGRYLTVTGNQVPGTPAELGAAPGLVMDLIHQYATAPARQATEAPPELPVVGPTPDIPFLTHGTSGSDRSRSLFAAACSLAKSMDDPGVLAHLCNSPYAWALAEEHRPRSTPEATAAAATSYLWAQVCAARGKVGEVEVGFELLDAEPEVHAGLQAIEYTLDGFLTAGVTFIAGAHGIGKSSLLVPLASFVSGELEGLRVALPRHVVYITEDTAQAHRVRFGLSKHNGLDESGLFHIVQAKRKSVDYWRAKLASIVAKFTVEGPNGYMVKPLVVFDTTNACFDIESENDSAEVGRVMSMLKEPGCPVWIVGHLAKSISRTDLAGMSGRGSGAWEADAQCTAFIFTDDEASSVRYMVTKKRRFEAKFVEVRYFAQVAFERVLAPWGEVQELGYMYGMPEVSTPQAREADKAERKEAKADLKTLKLVDAIVQWIDEVRTDYGAVYATLGKVGRRPHPTDGYGFTWAKVWARAEGNFPRPDNEADVKARVMERFEPLVEGQWRELVPKVEGIYD